MDLIPEFCRRKHGIDAVSYPHPATKEILKETQVHCRLSGAGDANCPGSGGLHTLGSADLLRRAMGKKEG